MKHFNTYGFPETTTKEKDLLHLVEWKDIEGVTLEVGSGTGRFLRQFKEHGKDITGADSSERMVRIGKEYAPVVKTDGKLLPFASKGFDNVLCHGVLHHNKEWPGILREIMRVWNRKGFLIIGIVCKYSWFYYFRKFKPPMIHFNKHTNIGRQLNDWFHAPYYFIESELHRAMYPMFPNKISYTSAGALKVYFYKASN